jgi:formate hydrogenlyase subunit 3/multisubunit Na+/H+ antiporter MnhD subunit
MNANIILLPICIPLAAGILVLAFSQRLRFIKEALSVLACGLSLAAALFLFKKEFSYSLDWLGYGIDFSLRLDRLSAFTVLAACAATFLVSIYSVSFMRLKPCLKQFYAWLLISLAFVNGAALSDNLVLLLFFWEGLLFALFGMIAIGGKDSFRTAVKAVIIIGISDICLMFGIALTGKLCGTLAISKISLAPVSLGALAFILLIIGAISKAGSMPFHTWIPDAAQDAPLPFMAF